MANTNAFLQTFAGGEFGDAMSARVGIEAYQASCELMENFFPLAQGPMTRRPSLEHIDSFANSDLKGIIRGFQFDVGQNYLLLITSGGIDFYLNDGKLEIPEVTAVIANGQFNDFTGWTDASSGGTASASAANTDLVLHSDGAGTSRARSSFTVNEEDEIHTIAFDVVNGPVNLRLGTSAGAEDLLSQMELRTGYHMLSFVPTGSTCHIEFWHKGDSKKRVDNLEILTGPDFVMPTPWAEEDMRGIYTAQDGDRLFMFHRDYPPRVLERRGHRSWSLIFFEPNDGPYDAGDNTITMTPSATVGEVTLTASRSFFTSDDERRLIRLTHRGQSQKLVAASGSVFGKPIKITGIGIDRTFSLVITGTFVGTLTLERSIGNENNYQKVLTHTTTFNDTYNDSYDSDTTAGAGTDEGLFDVSAQDDQRGTLNNLTIFYRMVVYAGEWTSGTAHATLSSSGGSQIGRARILSVASGTSATIEVIDGFGGTGATDVWDIGTWCPQEEYPNCVAFSVGRLWTARRRRLWASVSDDYFSFDDGTQEADESIDVTLRSRSSEGIRWMRHLDFLCIGTRNEEYVIRPQTLAEPLGPTNIDPGLMSEEGGALIEAVVGGDSIIFVHRSLRRIFQFAHNPRALTESSFLAIDLNRLNPEAVEEGIVNIAIQQEPERRIFIITKSGVCKTALFRREEEIVAWSTFRTEGFIEDVCVFPENDVDATYFIVRRKIGSSYVRMIERLQNEVVLNDEDLVCLDSMLQTEIDRREAILTFDEREAGETVTVTASQSVFTADDVNKILWADNGRIRIDTFNDVFEVEGTILNELEGEQDPDDEDARIPVAVSPGKWGIATPVTSVTGLDHLEGETVHIWADKAYFGTAVVSSGAVELSDAASRVFVGKRVISRWKGLRMAYAAQKGSAVMQSKNAIHMGFILSRTADGLKFGQDFKRLKALNLQSSSPVVESGVPFYSGEIHVPVNGKFDMDPRLTIVADTPGPATIKGLLPNVQVNER